MAVTKMVELSQWQGFYDAEVWFDVMETKVQSGCVP